MNSNKLMIQKYSEKVLKSLSFSDCFSFNDHRLYNGSQNADVSCDSNDQSKQKIANQKFGPSANAVHTQSRGVFRLGALENTDEETCFRL